MKLPLAAVTLLALALTAFAGDIKPDKPETPLFQVFEPIPKQGTDNVPSFTFDPKHPLLTVTTVRDLILAHDDKGVMLGLNAKDTKVFTKLTHQYNGRYLILIATDDVGQVLHITGPIEDGYIGFKHPESANFAQYLRKRFRIAEFK